MRNATPSAADDYIATLGPDQQSELRRIQEIIVREVPTVEQGESYGMPAYLHRGKALLSCMVRKDVLSIYPFSGKVIDTLRSKLEGYELTTGSIHFNLDRPLPASLIVDIIRARMQEIVR